MARITDQDAPKPRNDAYTGLLAISFTAMMIGCLLLFIDWYQYYDMKPPKVQRPPIKAAGAPPRVDKVEKEPPAKVEKEAAKKAEPKADDKAKMDKDKAKMDEKGKDEKGKDKDAKDKADAKEKAKE